MSFPSQAVALLEEGSVIKQIPLPPIILTGSVVSAWLKWDLSLQALAVCGHCPTVMLVWRKVKRSSPLRRTCKGSHTAHRHFPASCLWLPLLSIRSYRNALGAEESSKTDGRVNTVYLWLWLSSHPVCHQRASSVLKIVEGPPVARSCCYPTP